jgi:hypothetical protein
MSNIVRYNGETGRGPSPAIWGDLTKIRDDSLQGKCSFLYDDFTEGHNIDNTANTPTGIAGEGASLSYCDDGASFASVTTVPDLGVALGEVATAGNDADNDEVNIQFGRGFQGRIDNASGNTGALFFEARIKTASIADNGCSFFIGLSSLAPAANNLLDNSGAFAAASDFIGFRTLAADGDVLEYVHQAASQTVNTVGDAATLVADDYVKVGLAYRPGAVTDKVTFYVNGAALGTTVTESQMDEATFPEGVILRPVLFTKVGTAAAVVVTLDWIAAAQYLDSSAVN